MEFDKMWNLIHNQESDYERLELIKRYDRKAYNNLFKKVYRLDEYVFKIKIVSAQKATFIDKIISSIN